MENELRELGLTGIEARTYLTLVRQANLSGTQLARLLEIPRSSAYAALNALAEKGLVESGSAYGSKFRVVPPELALPLLIDRERDVLVERERVAKNLAQQLGELIDSGSAQDMEEVVEVLRDQRVVGERHQRLLTEVQSSIHAFVKAPIIDTRSGNPEEEVALNRGVRIRSLYESAVLDDELIGPYLEQWISSGEDARVYPGELPFKLALFDARIAIMPLETPGQSHPYTSILIRNDALGRGLLMLFERLWNECEPLKP